MEKVDNGTRGLTQCTRKPVHDIMQFFPWNKENEDEVKKTCNICAHVGIKFFGSG